MHVCRAGADAGPLLELLAGEKAPEISRPHVHVRRGLVEADAEDVVDPQGLVKIADEFLNGFDANKKVFAQARTIAKAYPRSDGARVIRELLELADADRVTRKTFVDQVRKMRTRLKRRKAVRT